MTDKTQWAVGDFHECGGGLQMLVVSAHGSRAVLYDTTPRAYGENDGPFVLVEATGGADWVIVSDDETGFASYAEALATVSEAG